MWAEYLTCWYLPIDLMPVIFLGRTRSWGQYPMNPKQIVWGWVRFCKNLMNLPSYISELTELNAVWLQPPLQTPHPSCAQYSCGIFNWVSLLFLLCLELGVSWKQNPSTARFSHVKPHVFSFLGLKEKDQQETLDTVKISIPNWKGQSCECRVKWDEVAFQKDSQSSSCLLWCCWAGRSDISAVLMFICWFRYKP